MAIETVIRSSTKELTNHAITKGEKHNEDDAKNTNFGIESSYASIFFFFFRQKNLMFYAISCCIIPEN